MPKVQVKYAAHISVVTGKFSEYIDVQGETIKDLIQQLDKKYPGLKEIFITPTGELTVSTYIYLRRVGEPTVFITDLNTQLKDNDVVTLW